MWKAALRQIRLMLVDDHPVMRAGLANRLSLDPDLEVVASAIAPMAPPDAARH